MEAGFIASKMGCFIEISGGVGLCPLLSGMLERTMRFGSTAKVLLKCRLKYYRISECERHVQHTSTMQAQVMEPLMTRHNAALRQAYTGHTETMPGMALG